MINDDKINKTLMKKRKQKNIIKKKDYSYINIENFNIKLYIDITFI